MAHLHCILRAMDDRSGNIEKYRRPIDLIGPLPD
jgi:hypothetical protein